MAPLASVRATLLALLVTACTGSEAAVQGVETFPDAQTRRRTASPVREVAVSSSDASFTAIPRLDVDSRGLIYVPDTYQQRVTVLGPDGKVRRVFGRRGSGPNEFRSIQSIQVLPGDSVLVYDAELGRVSVFAPDSGLAAYHVNLPEKLSVSMPRELRRTRANDAMLGHFRPGFAFGQGQDFSKRMDKVRALELDGAIRKELLTFPSQAFLVAQTSVTPNPFGNEGFARLDSQGRVHFLWTDTLGVQTYDLDGNRVGGFQIKYAPPAVTQSDVADAVADFPTEMRSMFESVLGDSTPARWPAVRQFLIDDRDRLWFAISGNVREETEWAAFSTEGAYLGSVLVPPRSTALLIRADGALYAERVDEDDVPQMVMYRMVRPLR